MESSGGRRRRPTATRITPDGKERGIRYRRAFRLDPEDEGLDLTEPLYLTAYGERDKKGGLARLLPGADRTDLLLWEDAAFQRLVKAERAPVLVFSKESALDYPDLWVTDPDLRAGRRLTNGGVQREGLSWTAGPHAGRLQVRQGRAAAGVAPASRRLREGPDAIRPSSTSTRR